MVVPHCITRDEAFDVLADACKTLGIETDYMEVDECLTERRDRQGGASFTPGRRVCVSALLPSAQGSARFRQITASAPRVSQAVAKVVAQIAEILERMNDERGA